MVSERPAWALGGSRRQLWGDVMLRLVFEPLSLKDFHTRVERKDCGRERGA